MLKYSQICMIQYACDVAGCAYPVGLQAVLLAIEYAEGAEFLQRFCRDLG